MFLQIDIGLRILVVILLFLIFIGFTIFINKLVKRQETIKKGIIFLYVADIIMFFGFSAIALWLFNFDYQTELQNLWNNINSGLLERVGEIIGTVVTVFVAMFIIKITNILIKKASGKARFNQKRIITILKVIKSLIKYAVDIIALLIILALWGVNIMPALAGLGILGIIIGMGTQSLIKDFISGFFIVFEHHFDVGDIVEINGWKGEVIDVGLKSTKVRNWKQDIKIFSNGSIENTINYTLSPSTAIIDFGIAYKEDVQKTVDLLNLELPKYVEKFPDITEPPIVLGVTELANSSVNLRVIIRTATEKHYAIERAFRQIIKEILDANDIEIPFPQVTVHQA